MSRRGNRITLTVHVPEGTSQENICQDALATMFIESIRRDMSSLSDSERDEILIELANAL